MYDVATNSCGGTDSCELLAFPQEFSRLCCYQTEQIFVKSFQNYLFSNVFCGEIVQHTHDILITNLLQEQKLYQLISCINLIIDVKIFLNYG